MQKKKPGDLFWAVLGMFNLLVVSFRLSFCLQVEDDLERLLATFVLIGAGLLLAIVDRPRAPHNIWIRDACPYPGNARIGSSRYAHN